MVASNNSMNKMPCSSKDMVTNKTLEVQQERKLLVEFICRILPKTEKRLMKKVELLVDQ
jgi:hypothetical protein